MTFTLYISVDISIAHQTRIPLSKIVWNKIWIQRYCMLLISAALCLIGQIELDLIIKLSEPEKSVALRTIMLIT